MVDESCAVAVSQDLMGGGWLRSMEVIPVNEYKEGVTECCHLIGRVQLVGMNCLNMVDISTSRWRIFRFKIEKWAVVYLQG